MKRPHELARENEALRARLGEAGLRVTEDPGFNSALQGVLDAARAPAAARSYTQPFAPASRTPA